MTKQVISTAGDPNTDFFCAINGKLHSIDDLPAVIYTDGTRFWYENGKISRKGDKPAVVWANGVIEYWEDGLRHRLKGAALIYPDTEEIHPSKRGIKQVFVRGLSVGETR